MQLNHIRLGQILLHRGVISQAQLDKALHEQRTAKAPRKIGEILVHLNDISESHIAEGLSEQLGIPIIYISERDIPEQVRNLIEADVVMLYRVVPIEERGDALVVATSTPESKLNLDNVSRLIGRPVAPVITTSDEIDFVLRRYYGLTQ
jgi:hypothetical protein